MSNKSKKIIMLVLGLLFLGFANYALAATGTGGSQNPVSGGIATIADNIRSNFTALAQMITAAAYIAGFGFAFAAILKFKAHKDNPQQIPVGTPIALLFIAAALIFLPSIFSVSGKTVFGNSGTAGTVSGTTSLPGFGNNK